MAARDEVDQDVVVLDVVDLDEVDQDETDLDAVVLDAVVHAAEQVDDFDQDAAVINGKSTTVKSRIYSKMNSMD